MLCHTADFGNKMRMKNKKVKIGKTNHPDAFVLNEIIKTKTFRLAFAFVEPSLGLTISKREAYIYIHKLLVCVSIGE